MANEASKGLGLGSGTRHSIRQPLKPGPLQHQAITSAENGLLDGHILSSVETKKRRSRNDRIDILHHECLPDQRICGGKYPVYRFVDRECPMANGSGNVGHYGKEECIKVVICPRQRDHQEMDIRVEKADYCESGIVPQRRPS